MLKRIFSFTILLFLLFGLFQNNVFANKKEKKYFRVTAYYSPLPNQSHYIKGNYKKELIMNGMGIKGASGKKVFSGMLAAPSIYSFGTKIKLKGLGVGEVADRGGAIVKAGERSFKHDRIDIWCGYGEKGLQRAMYWGNRIIEGEIISKKSKVTLNISTIPAPRWTIYHAIKNPDLIAKKGTIKRRKYLASKRVNKRLIPKKIEKTIFDSRINSKEEIKDLQKKLTEMELYSGKINGEYSSIREIILNFQLKNKLIKNNKTRGAGNFGPSTRKNLKKEYKLFLKKKEIEKKETLKRKKIEEEKIKKKLEKKEQEERIRENLFKTPIQNKQGVKALQEILVKVKLYTGKVDGDYSKIRKIILNFQLENKLISNIKEIGAGNFGPKTRTELEKFYKTFLKQEKEKKELEKKKKIKDEARKKLETEIEKEIIKKVNYISKIKFGDVSPNVREFQKILKELGYFKQKSTAIFGEKTKNALVNYQIDKKVISNKNIYGAGLVGPLTKKSLVKDLVEKRK